MTALTKAEMAEQLFEDLGLNKREAKEIVEAFFEEIRQSLENNEQVKLSGFGNFDLRDKRSRPGRYGNVLACFRVPTGPRPLITQIEIPKPGKLDLLIVLERLSNLLKECLDDFLGFALVEA